MRVAYADPPYPGCAHLYPENTEVDHGELIEQLKTYDGWCLHTSSIALYYVQTLLDETELWPTEGDYRVCIWVKPFAAFKRNVSVAYAWEPVLVKPARKPVVKPGLVYRDWIAEPITMRRGLTGAKPDAVCRWLFELMGLEPDDKLDDLYPGTGAVTNAWNHWRNQTRLAV